MNIYQYEDYRQYLKARYEEEKNSPLFSCRKFAIKAGFSNPGFINDVIRGRRKLSDLAVKKLIRVFGLFQHEAEFFRLLVAFAHARKTAERDRIYKTIVYRRARSSFAKINPEAARYYQDFRYPLIRAAIMVLDYHGESEMISRFLMPAVPANQVKKYVRDLSAWGLVKLDESGKYTVTEKFVEPAPTLNAQVKEINREWLKQADEALLTLDVNQRHISSMLLSISSGTRDAIFEKIERFRDEIWTLVRNDPEAPECVMLLNTQFIPRSREKGQP